MIVKTSGLKTHRTYRNEYGRATTRKTEDLTHSLIRDLEGFETIVREKYMNPNYKDVFAIDDKGFTYGFEVKTHYGDLTSEKNYCILDDCDFNFLVVTPDLYYHAVKWLEKKQYNHVGIVVGNRLGIDVVKCAYKLGGEING